MLRFFAFLLCFCITSYAISNDVVCSEYNQQDDTTVDQQNEDEHNEDIILLSYNSGSKIGKIIQTSVECSDDEEKDKAEEKAIQEEIKEISCDKIMEKDFANMRIIQLAGTIADDMGIITKVSLNR